MEHPYSAVAPTGGWAADPGALFLFTDIECVRITGGVLGDAYFSLNSYDQGPLFG